MSHFTITGIDATFKALGEARVRFRKDAVEAVKACTHHVFTLSQKYVPVETGALKASGEEVYRPDRFGGVGTIFYGGPTAPYAGIVHEDLTKRHAEPTCAKFLERAVRESRDAMSALMRAHLGGSVFRITAEGIAESTG